MKRMLLPFVLLAPFVVVAACGPAMPGEGEGEDEEVTFADIRMEIFQPSCGCHQGATPQAGLLLDEATELASVLDTDSPNYTDWKYIIAGDLESSLIYRRISGGVEGESIAAMPAGSDGLSSTLQELMAGWIEAGVPE